MALYSLIASLGASIVLGGCIYYGLLTGFNFSTTIDVSPVGGIWVAGAGALFGAGIVAILTERLAYKPIRERTAMTLYLLIASMGVNIVIENIFVIVVGGRFRALPQSMFPTGLYNLGGGITVSSSDMLSLACAVLFLGGLQFFLTKTRWGLAIRAAACDLRTAGLMGINVAFLIGIVFFVAGLLAAVGGIFLSYRYTLYPQLGGITTKAFVAAVIGGLGSLPGAVVGSLILGLAEMLTAGFISSQMRDLVVFSMLVLMLLVKPAGFFGKQISDKI